jgi:dihydropteroate synthase
MTPMTMADDPRDTPDLDGPPDAVGAPSTAPNGDPDAGVRRLPEEHGVVPAQPGSSGGSATPSFARPVGAPSGVPGIPEPLLVGGTMLTWGERTYVMGIVNVTPDSFSGDGLLAAGGDPVAAAVAIAGRMIDEGADLIDIGGESSRPGHASVTPEDERRRVVPVVAAIHAAFPDVPLSIDTTKPSVAAAALDAGASLLNDVWGVAEDSAIAAVAAERGVAIVLMHNRAEARYTSVVAEIVADLQRAIDRALRIGVAWTSIVVDPGFGFGKAPVHNLALLHDLAALRILGRPVLLGTSRKSTLGKVLDLPPDERLEATLATTALGVAAGVDIVRVHDVRANVRVARMSDAIVRPGGTAGRASDVAAS